MSVSHRVVLRHLVFATDLMGTATFAAEGAITGVAVHLDIFGVLVLAFVTALGGGIIRDVLLGSLPPSAVRDWRYPAIALATGLLVFFLHASTSAMHAPFSTVLDAAGLSFCAVTGATKALEYELHPLLAMLIGAIAGVGGGTIRDLLISEIPSILKADVYAVAALLGAAVVILLLKLKVPPKIASGGGVVACFTLRMVAVAHHWNLPHA